MKALLGALVLAGSLGAHAESPAPTPAAYDAELAKRLGANDPGDREGGEMVVEYHKHFGSAALMQVPQTHKRLVKKSQ